MSTYHLHKRYLVYINRTSNPRFTYPTTISENLRKLHSIIPREYFERPFNDEKVIGEIFIPENLKSIHIGYYHMILNLSKFFDCIAVWRNYLTEGGQLIKTVEIWGYYNDFKLCMHYLRCIIDSFNHVKAKKQEKYRQTKILARGRSKTKARRTNDARTKAIGFMVEPMRRMGKTWEHNLKLREDDGEISFKKFKNLYDIIMENSNLDHRKFRNREIDHCFSRALTFQKNRVLR